MSAFEVPRHPKPDRDFQAEFDRLMREGQVNAVNHGEFEHAATQLILEASVVDVGRKRAKALAIQRCRRGGKTFMLHGVASKLSGDQSSVSGTRVIFISMNSITGYTNGENAYTAILSRVAWELSGREPKSFLIFRQNYNDYGAVDLWLTSQGNRVILIVDELNIVPPTAERYGDMSALLDNFMQQEGCALLYSTHQRSTADLLRGRDAGDGNSLHLSKRVHKWVPIPRIMSESCLHGLLKNPTEQPSFWCAVLRGRVPALVLQDPEDIESYAQGVFNKSTLEAERQACLAAVITGKIHSLTNSRNLFRAYSYMSERFKGTDEDEQEQALFAWPAFMVAQRAVLGKDYRRFRATLENPDIDEPKAFEAIVQLAVLVRLLSDQQHPFVPSNSGIRAGGSAFEATEMFHVAETATTLEGIVEEVCARFSDSPEVIQVVAVPMFASFPTYDFFLLHKGGEGWTVAAGYQCKQGTENPSEDAWNSVPMSVWVEGKCRKYRVKEDGRRVSEKLHRGWVLLGESNQFGFLGVSMSEALPRVPVCEPNPLCLAENSWKQRKETGASEMSSKKVRLH